MLGASPAIRRPQGKMMPAQLDVSKYRRALLERGLTSSHLVRRPPHGPGLSKPTVAALNAGRPVAVATLRRLAAFLATMPPLPELAALLADGPDQTADAGETSAVEEVGDASARLQL